MLASHLSRPRVGSLVVNWNLRHSQTDPWFRVTLVSKEEVLECNGVVGMEKDWELLKRAKKPMKFLWDNNFRWQSSSPTAGQPRPLEQQGNPTDHKALVKILCLGPQDLSPLLPCPSYSPQSQASLGSWHLQLGCWTPKLQAGENPSKSEGE